MHHPANDRCVPEAEVSLRFLNVSYEEKQSFRNEGSRAARCPKEPLTPSSIAEA